MFIGDVRESRKAEARVVWIATIAALGAALPFQVLNCCQGLGGLSRLVIRFSSLEPADFSLPVIRHGLFSPSPNRSNISSVCRHSPTFPNATLASGFSKEARPHSPFPTREPFHSRPRSEEPPPSPDPFVHFLSHRATQATGSDRYADSRNWLPLKSTFSASFHKKEEEEEEAVCVSKNLTY